jgi:hypothetical protein
MRSFHNQLTVIPAKAGTHREFKKTLSKIARAEGWVPASAGMTNAVS